MGNYGTKPKMQAETTDLPVEQVAVETPVQIDTHQDASKKVPEIPISGMRVLAEDQPLK